MVSSNKQAKAPISSHRAFPAIVALWFGALLGIGSLIVPAAVFEQILAISGLAEIVPATKAPLGFSARLGIAVAGTAIGVLAGLLLARKVAGARLRQGRSTGNEDDFPWAKPPICALEELGALSLDQPVEDESAVEPAAGDWVDDSQDRANQAEVLHSFETPEETSGEAEIVLAEVDVAHQAFAQNPPTGMSAEQLIRRPLDELGIVQLVERFALSLQQRPADALLAQKAASAAPLPVADFPIEDARYAKNTTAWKAAFAAGEQEDDDAEVDEEFSSLLNLRKASAGPRKCVELPEDGDSDPSETVAVFPRQEGEPGRRKFTAPVAVPALEGQASEKDIAAVTERTLRGALEQLQKMSGVG